MRHRLAVLIALALPLVAAHGEALPLWRFDARLATEHTPLEVRACSPVAQDTVDFDGEPGAELLQVERSSGAALIAHAGGWRAHDWQAGECLHTRIDLLAIARRDRYGLGHREGHYLRAAPTRWLLRPQRASADSTIGFALPSDWKVSVPWAPAGDGRHRLGDTPADWPAQVVFGRFESTTAVFAGDRQLRITVVPTADGIDDMAIARWLMPVARVLGEVGGSFPREQVQVLVLPLPGVDAAVPWGQVTRGGGAAVHLFIGANASAADREADWTAHHEFAHLLHPYLGNRGRWLAEGLGSYYQNVLRARAGVITSADAWSRLQAGFARGRAATPSDAGPMERVARTAPRGSTMRVYWAGAAFWLETDRALRGAGDSLDRLLGAFNAAHPGKECCWTPESFIDALHALAPEAGLPERYRRHARLRSFPLAEAELAAWSREMEKPDSVMAAIFARP
jgi:hypothetical protein